MSDKNQGLRRLVGHINEKSKETIYVAEAVVDEVRKSDKKVKLVLLPDLEEIGWVRMLMLTGDGSWSTTILPPDGSTVIVLFPRGQRDMAVCLTGNLMEAGETGVPMDSEKDIIINDSWGNKISLIDGKIKIESGTVEITGSTQVKVNNGALPVARQTDTVQSPFGPLLITGGNSTFLA